MDGHKIEDHIKPTPNSEKRAKVFDLQAIFEETKKAAQIPRTELETLSNIEVTDSDEKRAGATDFNSSTSVEKEASGDEDDFMPILPPDFVSRNQSKAMLNERDVGGSKNSDNDDDYEDYTGEGLPVVKLIPAACEATVTHGTKPVTALCFDHPGARFLSGGLDCAVNMYDFAKMDRSLKFDRQLFPCDNNIIHHLSFSPNGETIIVCNGSPQVKLLDRKGTQFGETVRGDKYLVDLTNTKGHTAAVNCSAWNPIVKGEFITCSDDGTVRIWNLEDFKDLTRQINKQKKVIKTKNANGKRAMPQACAYSRDGKFICAGCDDGSLQIWKYGKLYVAPSVTYRNAHSAPITSIAFSPDSKRILTRSLDDTLKMWSVTDPKAPLHMAAGLETGYKMTDCGWSPRGELIYTCTSSPNKDIAGTLVFYNPETFEMVYKIEYPGVSCIRVAWHARLNQILVGLSDGNIKLYYDTSTSHSGALTCVTRPIRRARQQEVIREDMVLSPLALEMFQARGEEGQDKEVTAWRLRKYLRQKDNELRPEFRKPADMPMSGPSSGGRVASSGGTLHSYVAQQIGKQRNKDFLEDTDVRASILRHAEEAEKNPFYVNKAYKRTQPVAIFAEKTTAPEEEEEEEEIEPHFKVARK